MCGYTHGCGKHTKLFQYTKYMCSTAVLLEYFAGKKPLQISQISKKFDPLLLHSGKDHV